MRIFKEEQRFNQLWLILLMAISMLVPIGIIIGTYIKDPNSFTLFEFILILSLMIIASTLIFTFKLTSKIDEKGIHYKFFPFHRTFKLINWNTIDNVYIRQYDAISEYGGWGLKGGSLWRKNKGKAINVSGDIGIQIIQKNGKKLLIGTQKKAEAERVLQTYKSKINNNG
ncbi:hypothetical protein [uncultured Winogradskyella sp.]|uniref:hypothetical protein n=1 Tax=uncultured Winogradskyella sp. TaxID=395353 RepID=UPI002634028E|nr:hypothetical protein [uncultured Winogradskyella sp.]